MNSFLHLKNDDQRGNAMIYVLIGLALFGFLTVTLSSQNDQADGQDIKGEQIVLYANELTEYASVALQTANAMISTGSEVDDLDFVKPSEAAFDTAPHYHKVFHPQGGGLNYSEDIGDNIGGPTSFSANKKWYFLNTTNVEWTQTSANDAIITAFNIKKEICENINRKILGNTTVPALAESLEDTFETGIENLDISNCPACEGYPTLCVSNAAIDGFAFYTIIAAQ